MHAVLSIKLRVDYTLLILCKTISLSEVWKSEAGRYILMHCQILIS